jgi:hypothetical protein
MLPINEYYTIKIIADHDKIVYAPLDGSLYYMIADLCLEKYWVMFDNDAVSFVDGGYMGQRLVTECLQALMEYKV